MKGRVIALIAVNIDMAQNFCRGLTRHSAWRKEGEISGYQKMSEHPSK